MSLMRNGTIRCDRCGKWSRHKQGEYTKPDGSAGNINSKGLNGVEDWCEECAAVLWPSESDWLAALAAADAAAERAGWRPDGEA
mgnify:CR=1 FL=1